LHGEKRLIYRFPDEWAEGMQRPPHRDRGKDENSRGSFALRKAEGSPNHNGSANYNDWIISGETGRPSAKTIPLNSTSNRRSAPTSAASFLFQRRFEATLHRRTKGVKTRSPFASPSHHVSQIAP